VFEKREGIGHRFRDIPQTAGTLGVGDFAIAIPPFDLRFDLIDRRAFSRGFDFILDLLGCPSEAVTDRRHRIVGFLESHLDGHISFPEDDRIWLKVDRLAGWGSAEVEILLSRNAQAGFWFEERAQRDPLHRLA